MIRQGATSSEARGQEAVMDQQISSSEAASEKAVIGQPNTSSEAEGKQAAIVPPTIHPLSPGLMAKDWGSPKIPIPAASLFRIIICDRNWDGKVILYEQRKAKGVIYYIT